MGRAGLFGDERVELIGGVIITMSPQDSGHAGTVHRIQRVLSRALGRRVYIRVQAPIILDDWSEPEPNLALCDPDLNDYTQEHPRSHQVRAVIEVARTSLTYDRGRKLAAYAGSGIPVCILVNLRSRRLEVFTQPDTAARRYRHTQVLREKDRLAVLGRRVTVSSLLPLR